MNAPGLEDFGPHYLQAEFICNVTEFCAARDDHGTVAAGPGGSIFAPDR